MMVDDTVEEGEAVDGRVFDPDEQQVIGAGIKALLDRAEEMGWDDAQVHVEEGLKKLMEEWD